MSYPWEKPRIKSGKEIGKELAEKSLKTLREALMPRRKKGRPVVDRDPCVPVDQRELKALRAFFREWFDAESFHEGYTDAGSEEFHKNNSHSCEKTIRKVKNDRFLKLAVKYRLVTKWWVKDLIETIKDIQENELK